MEKESDLNFPDENNYSVTSTDLSEDLVNSYMVSPTHTLSKRGNKYGNMPNFGHQLPYNKDMAGSNGMYPKDQLKDYLLQLKHYLNQYSPELMNVFQNPINGDYEEDQGRVTPLQFSDNHVLHRLDFPGLMYQLAPNTIKHEGGIIIISDEVFPKSYEFPYDDYPGPLTLEKTTEEQIYSYLKDQMSIELQDTSPIDWDSGHLLINYLELMIKENGKPRIGNIVRLLNEGVETKTADLRKDCRLLDSISRNSFSRASSRATSRASSRPSSPSNLDRIDLDLPQNSLDTPQGPGSVTSMVRRAVNNATNDQKLCMNMDRYRQYIVTGRFEEAVRFATKSGIWDHAFALALRMNNTQLTNEVLIAFSRSAIYSNDPLYTMHELMAQKPPKISAANRGFSNNEMGDWRCHLGMILAVKKYRPEECRQAIESMGEKLSALRSYYAAHLCYLLAGTQFGLDRNSPRYRRKFDLIGWQSSTGSIPAQKSTYANCHKLFTGLDYWRSAPEQSIKLTEVYEYAMKFCGDNQHASLSVHLIPYKYLMVYKMLSKNQVKSAYEYCMNIGEILGYKVNWLECESINFRIILNIRDLSFRLNSWLTIHDDSVFSGVDNAWLTNIDSVYGLFCDKYNLWNPKSPQPDFFKTPVVDHAFNQSHPDSIVDYGMNGYSYAESVASSMYQEQYQPNQFNNRVMYQTNADVYNQTMNSKQQNVNQYQLPVSMMGNMSISQSRPAAQQSANYRQSDFPDSMNSPSQTRPVQPSVISRPSEFVSHQNLPQQTSATQKPFTQLKYENTAFRNIAPPSELPNEAIMTEPPKFVDMKHTTSSIVDRASSTHNTYDAQRLRFENSMKMQQNEAMVYTNKTQPPINDASQKFVHNVQPPSHQVINKNIMNKNVSLTNETAGTHGEYESKFNLYSSTPNFGGLDKKANPDNKQFTFVPTPYNVDTEEDPIVDCFTSYGSRSRSQSNGSVGSIENHGKSSVYPALSRSRNSSESKESMVTPYSNPTSRILEPTKEENDNSGSIETEKQPKQQESTETKPSKAWGFLNLLKPAKSKEIHLPKDNDKPMYYDNEKKRWIDKSNPEDDKPLTPPPILPALENPLSFNSLPDSSYQQDPGSANQFVKSRYRQANINVKPSAPVAVPPPNPTFHVPQSFGSNLNAPAPDRGYSQQYNSNPMDYGSPYGAETTQYSYNDQSYGNHVSLQTKSNPRNL